MPLGGKHLKEIDSEKRDERNRTCKRNIVDQTLYSRWRPWIEDVLDLQRDFLEGSQRVIGKICLA